MCLSPTELVLLLDLDGSHEGGGEQRSCHLGAIDDNRSLGCCG
jgi:hypothetical protein